VFCVRRVLRACRNREVSCGVPPGSRVLGRTRRALIHMRVLFLCTGNSCRSQMAEGWARRLWPAGMEALSAGTEARGLDPRAVKVMAEVGVDISSHKPKRIAALGGTAFDCVVTVCDQAREACPAFPGAPRQLHESFDDPPRLAAGARSEEDALGYYRRVRDEIRKFAPPQQPSRPAGPGARWTSTRRPLPHRGGRRGARGRPSLSPRA